MSLYHEAAQVLADTSRGSGSLKGRVFGDKRLKSAPGQVYALAVESCRWSGVLKEVIEASGILSEKKVSLPFLFLPFSHCLFIFTHTSVLVGFYAVGLRNSHALGLAVTMRGRSTQHYTLGHLRATDILTAPSSHPFSPSSSSTTTSSQKPASPSQHPTASAQQSSATKPASPRSSPAHASAAATPPSPPSAKPSSPPRARRRTPTRGGCGSTPSRRTSTRSWRRPCAPTSACFPCRRS